MNHLDIIRSECEVNPMNQNKVWDGNLPEIFPAIRDIDHIQVLIEGADLDVPRDVERLLNTFTKSELALLVSLLLMDNFRLHSELSEMRYKQQTAELLEAQALARHKYDNQN